MFEMFPRESVGRANAALNLLHIGAAFVIQTGIGLIVGFWAPKLRGALYPAVAYTTAFWRSSCCSYWRLPGSYARRGGLHSMVLAYLCRSQTQRDTSAIESKADASHPLRLPLVTRDAPSGCGRKRGADYQAIGRSRGGSTTKIHVAVDEYGWPRRLILRPVAATSRCAGEWRRPCASPMQPTTAMRSAICSRLGIPYNPTRKRMHPFDARTYRQRNVIERTFSRLKDFRRIATRECLSSVT